MIGIAGPTLFAGAVSASFPAQCNIAATVTFTPPLVAGGITSYNKAGSVPATDDVASGTATISSCNSSNTLGAPTGGSASFTITTKASRSATKNVNPLASPITNCGASPLLPCTEYTYDQADCANFTSPATLASLKHVDVSFTWTGEQFSGGSLATSVAGSGAGVATNNGGELGFALNGTATGDYAGAAQTTAYVLNDANGTNLLSGCPSGPVAMITIDGATSTVRV